MTLTKRTIKKRVVVDVVAHSPLQKILLLFVKSGAKTPTFLDGVEGNFIPLWGAWVKPLQNRVVDTHGLFSRHNYHHDT
jgi:hypothetical protein